MTITYRNIGQRVKIPVLHKVVYSHTSGGIEAMYQYSLKDHNIKEWLEENCRHPYYYSPGYFKEKFIEFECSNDALLFALRWAS